MSEEVKRRIRETLKSTREFVKATKKSMQEEVSRVTPKVAHTLDRPFDKAGQGLSNALSLVERKTSEEQMELLKAYRSFLQKQVDFVDSRIKAKSEKPATTSQS